MGNILNLVFENFDNKNIPLPNGYCLDKNTLCLPHILGLTNELFEIKYNRLNDIHLFDNFYFVICHKLPLFDYLSESDNLFISDVVKLQIRNKNLKVIFIQEHESEIRIIEAINLLNKLCIDNDLKFSNFYIINNNSELNSYERLTEINLHKIEFLAMWSHRALIKFNPKFVTNKLGKFCLLHNRTPKVHRIILLALLKKYNILENFDWSIIDGWRKNLNKDGWYYAYDAILSNQSIDNIKEELEFFDKIDVKKSDYELDTHWFDDDSKLEFEKAFMLDSYENSYINLVTESFFYEKVIHITEKAFKPFYFFQLPIFVSSCGYIKKLKELYGFDMFEDIINHNYDDEPDNEKRMFMIFSELMRLIENKSNIIEFYKNNEHRFIANQNIVKNIKNINLYGKLLLSLTKRDLHKTKNLFNLI
jgi:hypothetical protein